MSEQSYNLNSKSDTKYLKLKDEFQTYQDFAEGTIQMITEKNVKLEKKLDAITNIVEISKYINSYLSHENLISMINDMIIGILGATYSSIYLIEDDKLVIKATNIKKTGYSFCDECNYKQLLNGKPFIMNSKVRLFNKNSLKNDIHSLIGVPIYLRERFIGYIIVEHVLNNFFGHEHIKFISSIANQIAIALENNALYNRIKEIAIKDSLMKIYNRKHFFDVVEKKVEENKDQSFGIVMMDLDDFKKANDTYGHQFGDEVLRETAKIILDSIDEEDMVARYGGEEVVIYIQDIENTEKVYEKIDNIRKNICKNNITYGKNKGNITASFGISYYPRDGGDLNKALCVADVRLYVAKRMGKNRVVDK